MALIFVYGTLRRDGSRPIPLLFSAAEWVGDGTIRGSLFDFGAYPGLQLDDGGVVIGEVYQVTADMMTTMDDIERYDANDWNGSYYWRKPIRVQLHDASIIMAEVYEVNPRYFNCIHQIESGDWIHYAQTKGELPDERWPDEQPIANKVR